MVILRRKTVPTVPVLTLSKPAGLASPVIINPEVLASQTAPAPAMTVIRELSRQMPNTQQKAVPTAPVLTLSKPAGLASPVIQSQAAAAFVLPPAKIK